METGKIRKKEDLDLVQLGARIKQARIRSNEIQNYFANDLDITTQYLSAIENGKKQPSLEVLIKIAQKTGCTLDYLVFGDNYKDVDVEPAIKDLNHALTFLKRIGRTS